MRVPLKDLERFGARQIALQRNRNDVTNSRWSLRVCRTAPSNENTEWVRFVHPEGGLLVRLQEHPGTGCAVGSQPR